MALPSNPIYTSLQIGFQALVDAVERGDDLTSLQKKQRGILMLSEMARQLNLLDQERTQALRTLEQLDIQNTVTTLGRLLKLQHSFNETTVKNLTQQLENVTFTTERMEETFIKKALLAQQEIEHLKRQQIELKGPLYGFFRKCHWEELFGDVGEEPPLPPDILDILESPCPFVQNNDYGSYGDVKYKVQDTHKLILIPATIRGQPVTLNKLIELLSNGAKKIQLRLLKSMQKDIEEEFGDIPIKHSYWVLMSRVPFYPFYIDDPEEKLDRYTNSGYHFPKLLEAAICTLLGEMPQHKRQLRERLERTVCEEKNKLGIRLYVQACLHFHPLIPLFDPFTGISEGMGAFLLVDSPSEPKSSFQGVRLVQRF